ncbi:hypothetical protein D3C71_1739010 [compost metagenome]
MERVGDGGPHALHSGVQTQLIVRVPISEVRLVLHRESCGAGALLQDDVHHFT